MVYIEKKLEKFSDEPLEIAIVFTKIRNGEHIGTTRCNLNNVSIENIEKIKDFINDINRTFEGVKAYTIDNTIPKYQITEMLDSVGQVLGKPVDRYGNNVDYTKSCLTDNDMQSDDETH